MQGSLLEKIRETNDRKVFYNSSYGVSVGMIHKYPDVCLTRNITKTVTSSYQMSVEHCASPSDHVQLSFLGKINLRSLH